MNESPITTPLAYYARRISKLALIIVLLFSVRPALALFDTSDIEEPTITVVAGTEHVADTSASMASATGAGLDEVISSVGQSVPSITVTAALVKEIGAPKPLLVYRPNARWPLASVTKLMTAVVALEALGAATIVDVSAEAVATEGEAGNLKTGERYTIIDLVRAMLVVSSNDAAVAAAQAYDKKQLGKEAYAKALNTTALFTAAMQDKARSLGMSQSYYGDPSGLSVVSQSVVTDLEALINYIAIAHPQLLEITKLRTASILERKSMTRRTLININDLAGQADFLGGKTGRTDEAGGNLLSVFSYNSKRYLIIVLGTEDRFGETAKLYDWIKEINSETIVY